METCSGRELAAKFGHQFLLLFLSLLMMLGIGLRSSCPLDEHSVTELQGTVSPDQPWILTNSCLHLCCARITALPPLIHEVLKSSPELHAS